MPEEAASYFGLRVEQIDSVTALIMARFDISLFNSVVGLGVTEPATEELMDRITALYAPAGNTFVIRLAPGAQPAELVSWLEQRGFKQGNNWSKLYRGNEEPPNIPTDLRIECIGHEHTEPFVQVGMTAFEMPPDFSPIPAAVVGRPGWRNYIAFDGETPVAIASLFVRDGIGWLGNAATLPSHRRSGAQGALMSQRIRDGIEMDCDWFVTETGEETLDNPITSYHNMLRTGFKLAYLRSNFVLSGRTADETAIVEGREG